MRRSRRASWQWLCAILVAGCASGSGQELIVSVTTDLSSGVEFDSVRTSIEGSGTSRTIGAAVEDVFTGRPVAELGPLSPGPWTLQVELLLGGAPVASRRVRVRSDAPRYSVLVVISRSCRGVTCPNESSSPSATSCLGGRCVDLDCTAREDLACLPPECQQDAACSARVDCAVPRCAERTCVAVADNTRCAAGEYCDVERGCRPLGMPDRDAGTGCSPTSEACNGLDDDCDAVVDEGACLWQLPRGGTAWTRSALDAASPNAPTGPVRGALGLETANDAWVITDTHVHVLDLSTARWVDRFPRNSRFPEIGTGRVDTAFSVSRADSEDLFLLVGTTAYIYTYLPGGRRDDSTLGTVTPLEPTLITPPEGLSPPVEFARTKAFWSDLQNRDGYVVGDPRAFCPDPSPDWGAVVPYAVHLSPDGTLSVQDAGYCFRWFARMPVAEFGPFRRPGAPDFAAWRMAVHSGGLWLIP
jgi:hypothetical protein